MEWYSVLNALAMGVCWFAKCVCAGLTRHGAPIIHQSIPVIRNSSIELGTNSTLQHQDYSLPCHYVQLTVQPILGSAFMMVQFTPLLVCKYYMLLFHFLASGIEPELGAQPTYFMTKQAKH